MSVPEAPVEQGDEGDEEEGGDRRKKPIEPLPAVSWLECERKRPFEHTACGDFMADSSQVDHSQIRYNPVTH